MRVAIAAVPAPACGGKSAPDDLDRIYGHAYDLALPGGAGSLTGSELATGSLRRAQRSLEQLIAADAITR